MLLSNLFLHTKINISLCIIVNIRSEYNYNVLHFKTVSEVVCPFNHCPQVLKHLRVFRFLPPQNTRLQCCASFRLPALSCTENTLSGREVPWILLSTIDFTYV